MIRYHHILLASNNKHIIRFAIQHYKLIWFVFKFVIKCVAVSFNLVTVYIYRTHRSHQHISARPCNFFQIKSNIWAFFSFTFDVFASLNKMVESRERRTVNPFFSVLWIYYFHKYMGMYLIKPISAGCQPTSLLLVHTWFPIPFVRQLWAGTAWKVVF